jgi:hypothetical protein
MMMNLEILPIEIFPVIQEYLIAHDYRNFMNSNKPYFESIKYQSVHYRVYIEIKNGNQAIVDERFHQYDSLLTSVKDKSKQMELRLITVTPLILLNYAPKFQNIHFLFVSFSSALYSTFDFNIFNNIHTVQLSNLHDITTIHSGFENVLVFEICYAYQLEKILLNFKKFKCIRFYSCPRLIITPEIFECSSLEFDGGGAMIAPSDDVQLSRQIPYETLFFHSLRMQISAIEHCNLSCLQRLALHSLDARKGRDLSMFSHVRYLSLGLDEQSSYGSSMIFPTFYGQSLDLFGFDLSAWKSSAAILHVRKLPLSECMHIDPEILLNVRDITLIRIKEIEVLITLPICVTLSLVSLEQLIVIAPQPKLLILLISSCRELTDFSLFHENQIFNSVQFYECSKFISYEMFRNTNNLRCYINDTNNRSFPNFDQSILPMNYTFIYLCDGKINCRLFRIRKY